MTSKLHIGTISADGNVTSRPAIALYGPSGNLLGWHYLSGHEPHSTTFEPTLLEIP